MYIPVATNVCIYACMHAYKGMHVSKVASTQAKFQLLIAAYNKQIYIDISMVSRKIFFLHLGLLMKVCTCVYKLKQT